jgi:hypothetical protein
MAADDGRSGLRPSKGRRRPVPRAHVGAEVFAQRLLAGEIGQTERLLGKNPEETFDLVEP